MQATWLGQLRGTMTLAPQSLLASVFLVAILFGPAGTLVWPRGWAFLVLTLFCTGSLGAWLRKQDPALLAERRKSALGQNQAPRDRVIMAAISVTFLLWLVTMPLDARRFHWLPLPAFTTPVGAVAELCAYLGWAAVLRANTFAIPQIRLQPERRQHVITTGPYAVVRHPMYASALLFLTGAPLMLGSGLGLVFLAVFLPLLAARIAGEEALLRVGLTGYVAYTAKVRARMIPGLW